jgi:dCTP diphosphatase
VAEHSFTLDALSARIAAFNQERDWAQYHCPRNLAMALSVEVGELLELFLWSEDLGPQPPVAGRDESARLELADVAICLLNLANRMDVDLGQAVVDKLVINAEKYPVEKAKGRMEKSTEL